MKAAVQMVRCNLDLKPAPPSTLLLYRWSGHSVVGNDCLLAAWILLEVGGSLERLDQPLTNSLP